MNKSKLLIALILFLTIFAILKVNAQNRVMQTATFKAWGNCGMCKKTIEKSLKSRALTQINH